MAKVETRNNPLTYTDPSGHNPLLIILGIIVFGGSIFLENEMPVGEEAPAYDPVDNYVNAVCSPCGPVSEGQWGMAAGMAVLEVTPIDEMVPGANKVVKETLGGTADDLFAFGNKTKPRPPRSGIDVFPDSSGMLSTQSPPLPKGASTFGDVSQAPLTGQYHRLPAGTQLPDGLGVAADGIDVFPNSSPHPPTHHMIYPTIDMHIDNFIDLFNNLPWIHAGKKKK